MNNFSNLRRQGNLLESLLGNHCENNKIEIIRVYPYESRVENIFYKTQKEWLTTPEELGFSEVVDRIREKVDQFGWNDNKIAVELYIGYHHVFIGFWDSSITIGSSVIPTPKWPCHQNLDSYGAIQPVIVRENTPTRPK